MDLKTAMILSALILFMAGSEETTRDPSSRLTDVSDNTTRYSSSPPPPSAASLSESSSSEFSSPHVFGLLKVNWTSKCEGSIYLSSSGSSLPVCYSQETHATLKSVCEYREGCENVPQWSMTDKMDGYNITERGRRTTVGRTTVCCTLRVKCKEVLSDVHFQLQIFKVLTVLLCCVLLLLLLTRFTRPTVRALQKRFSDRRQNRWIGPTQSHSVSYHRGKTAVKNNEEEKRLSYPALERLMVSDSREPSSNRNSDYNF
ncbi:transmembrane protein 176 isoform X1 [Brachyistius frenatus]|uniref:transmembrane protein 176 isoform X1 n=1 Tax=Brachyistius frenatus TaxID=100188 RepID=UPI0037E8EE82